MNRLKAVISQHSASSLEEETKFCLNVEQSRLDVISSIQSVAKKAPPTEKQGFINQAIRTLPTLVSRNNELDKINFGNVATFKKEL